MSGGVKDIHARSTGLRVKISSGITLAGYKVTSQGRLQGDSKRHGMPLIAKGRMMVRATWRGYEKKATTPGCSSSLPSLRVRFCGFWSIEKINRIGKERMLGKWEEVRTEQHVLRMHGNFAYCRVIRQVGYSITLQRKEPIETDCFGRLGKL